MFMYTHPHKHTYTLVSSLSLSVLGTSLASHATMATIFARDSSSELEASLKKCALFYSGCDVFPSSLSLSLSLTRTHMIRPQLENTRSRQVQILKCLLAAEFAN